MRTTRIALIIVASIAFSSITRAQKIEWIQQFGSTDSDDGQDVSVDGLGNVYVAGATHSRIGAIDAGNNAAFIRKYDGGGSLLWDRQFVGGSRGFGVSTDGLGNVYTTGYQRKPFTR